MPILNLGVQPGSASIPLVYAAYRPIRFTVRATATNGYRVPPVVYCDIYFDGVFYKTLSATQYWYLWSAFSDWEFDISGSCQEYLSSFTIPGNGASAITASPMAVTSVFCRFRSSGYDANNFMNPEGLVPKQATASLPAVAGTGTESYSFQVMNAVLQHEDNPDFLQHLIYSRPNGSWNADTYPLTHRPDGYKVCKSDSDHYPFLHLGNKSFAKIVVNATLKNGTVTSPTYNPPLTCSSVVSNVNATVIPGNNVNVIFDSSGPASVWEWTITGGTTWTTVTSKQFPISWEDLLNIIITESGQEIITENGEIIIPEDVDVYGDYTVTVRPRCTNGAYGTSDSDTYAVEEALVCPLTSITFSSRNYTDHTITFDLGLDDVFTDLQLEWKFDYGNGNISMAMPENYTNAGTPFVWQAPVRANNGTYLVRIRTKCATDNFSSWTSWVSVSWARPTSNILVAIHSITEMGGHWKVICSLSEAVPDDVRIYGYFMGDGDSGGIETFTFICTIQAGATLGVASSPGSLAGGLALSTPRKIVEVTPNPTSNGKTLTYS